MISLAEYESLQETLHLLRDPANAERLLQSIAEAEAAQLAEHDVANEATVERTGLGGLSILAES
jgi:antitoxin YefM